MVGGGRWHADLISDPDSWLVPGWSLQLVLSCVLRHSLERAPNVGATRRQHHRPLGAVRTLGAPGSLEEGLEPVSWEGETDESVTPSVRAASSIDLATQGGAHLDSASAAPCSRLARPG